MHDAVSLSSAQDILSFIKTIDTNATSGAEIATLRAQLSLCRTLARALAITSTLPMETPYHGPRNN